jgi:hypothetical protein
VKRPRARYRLGGSLLLCLSVAAFCWPAPTSALIIDGLEGGASASSLPDVTATGAADAAVAVAALAGGPTGAGFALTLGAAGIVYNPQAVSSFGVAARAGSGWPDARSPLRVDLRAGPAESARIPFASGLTLGAELEEVLARAVDLGSSANGTGREFPFLAFLDGNLTDLSLASAPLN